MIGVLVIGGACTPYPLAAQSQISVGRNVQVSKANGTETHDEVLMSADSADPKRLLACGIVNPLRGHQRTVVYASYDGGASWAPVEQHTDALAGDPTCALGPGDHAYFASLLADPARDDKESPIYPKASYSTDAGKTWHDAVLPGSDKLDVDRDYIVADNVSEKYRGRVYFYLQMEGPGLDGGHTPMGITLWHSTDGGATFSHPIQTFPPTDKTVFWLAGSAVLSDGTFAALAGRIDVSGASERQQTELGRKQGELKLVTSSDGGETFNPAVKINDMYDHWTDADIARLAVDNSSGVFKDRLYAVWSDGRAGGRKHILLSYSADKGKTWAPPRRIDDDDRLPYGGLLRNAGMPAVAVNKDGVVGVSWYDRRDNATNDVDYWPRFAVSFDGGESFSPSVRVSEQPRVLGKNEEWVAHSDHAADSVLKLKADPLGVGFKVTREEWEWGGHTAGLAATADGAFHPLWIDNRTGMHQMWTAPVTVTGMVSENGSADLANMKDISGQCVLQIADLSYNRQQSLMVAKVQIRNVSKETISGSLKLRATELSSPVGKLQVANADNHLSSVGAVWDFSGAMPSGNLAPDASTQPVELRFKFTELYPTPFMQDKKFQPDWLTFTGHVLTGSK